MSRPFALRSILAVLSLATASLLIMYACQEDDPSQPEFARVNSRYDLTIKGTGSASSGMVTSDRGGISCSVSAGGGVSGKCSQGYKSGTIVALTLTPGPSDTLGTVSSNCAPSADSRQTCHVTMTGDMTVTVNFDPQSNTFALTISGGAAGSGGVTSSPSGISCTITNGSPGTTGCAASYSLNQPVTLTATAGSGSYLKAWAGGGCDVNGTIAPGSMSGFCVVTMSQSVALLVSFDRPANAALMGQWASPIIWPTNAVQIHANLLPNGQVLTFGRGISHQPVLWDPASGSFAIISVPVDLFCSGHALLPDGRLLVAGGHSGIDNRGIVNSEFYDYATSSWQPGPNMRNGRWYPTNVTLATGEMLTISGGDTAGYLNTIPEVWTPGGLNGTWRALTTAQASLWYYPMMFGAPNGTVFNAGPDPSTGFLNTSGTGSWTVGPYHTYADSWDYGSAVMYDAGKILVVGGGNPTAKAEVIDLNTGGAWTRTDSMPVARRQMNATLLADGKALVTGGSNAPGFNTKPTNDRVLAAIVWDPSTGHWTELARQTHYRLYHSNALLLPDARVVSMGSGQPAATGLTNDYSGEIFSPPYLFKADGTPAVRPTISAAPDNVGYGSTIPITISSAAPIAKVTFIRLSTVTHATNMNQRMNILGFTSNGSTLTVTFPASANLAPPGHYMLFIVDANGVPSVAKIVRIS